MVEEDTEVLDWGNEEEDQDFAERGLTAEDAEDAVSLGGDEDDEFLTYQTRVSQGAIQHAQSPSTTESLQNTADVDAQGKTFECDRPKTPTKSPREAQMAPEPTPILNRQLSFGKLTHALPPKPVVSSVPFVHPSHPSIIEATAMAARIDLDKKNGSVSKSATYEPGDALPLDWEVRHPRNGRGVYYYNSLTKESTWTHPGSSTSARDRRNSRIADDTRDMASISKTDDSLTSRIGRSDADATLSYDDRHYRPGENAQRPSMQSHGSQNDSFLATNRAKGERLPLSPPRHRTDDRVPSSRRQQSPLANGDRNRGRAPKKDLPRPSSPIATVDRVWVAPRNTSPVDRPVLHEGKRREGEQFQKDRERRETPRDADRMSATRPRSPVNNGRDGQYTLLSLSSNDSSLVHTGLSSRQKCRFSQAPLAQVDRRTPDISDRTSRDLHPQDALSTENNWSRHRTNDRHQADAKTRNSPDPVPQTLPSASLEQLAPPPPSPPNERFRKRVPLPPQRASFYEGSRSKADAGYPPSTPANRDHSSASRLINTDPQIPSGPRVSPAYMSSYNDPHTHEYRGKRDKNQMDIDDPPPVSSARTADPSRQLATSHRYREDRDGSAPKRPRAMMDDAEMPARRRSPDRPPQTSRSERKEPYRIVAHDDVSRSVPLVQEDRRLPAETLPLTSRDAPRRQVDMSRPPPTAPMPKLSGTNSMPIGGRGNRFGGSESVSPHPLLPSAPLPPQVTSTLQETVIVSGRNTQSQSRSVSGAREIHERPPHMNADHNKDQPSQIRAQGGHQPLMLLPSKPLSMPDPPTNVPVDTPLPPRSGGRASRTRFGPPVERVERKLDFTAERGRTPESHQIHLHDDRATSPPLSRASSMSLRDVHASQYPRHGAGSPRPRIPEPRSPAIERNEEKGLPERYGRGRNDHYGHGPTSQAPIIEKRVDGSHWSRSRDLPPPPQDSLPFASNGEGSQVQHSLPLAMHPERARLLQKGPHSLPPRPETDVGRPRSSRPRYSESGPRVPADSRSNQHSEDISFRGDRPSRPPNNHGGSLIDRLAVGTGNSSLSSLRDRVKVPMKRPQDDMAMNDGMMEIDEGHENKRNRRRGGKLRKPRRGA